MNNSLAGKIPKPETNDFITQPELLNVLNTPIRAPLHSNVTEESLQIEDECATKVSKPEIQRLTEKSEHFKHTNAEEQVLVPLAEVPLNPEKVDAGALIPEPKEIPVEPAIVHLPETKSKLPKAIENPEPKKSTAEEPVKPLPAQVSLPEQQHKEMLPKVPHPINMRLILSPKKNGHLPVLQIQASYLLGKGGYVFSSVGLFVCLSVNNITQKVMNGLV